MNIDLKTAICPLIFACLMLGCQRGPKVIHANANEARENSETGIFSSGTDIFSDDPIVIEHPDESIDNKIHVVVIEEKLPASKYIYLRVREGEQSYWIATTKKEIETGEVYFYRGGLLKTNFESKEYNRIFDQIYLVSNIVPANHASDNAETANVKVDVETHSTSSPVQSTVKTGDHTIKIMELVNNSERYDGSTIKIKGRCTKVNSNIMGRNWIHLQDGSMDNFDLVVTTKMRVEEGNEIIVQGIVSLNKDFGAGYKYDLIVEDGIVLEKI